MTKTNSILVALAIVLMTMAAVFIGTADTGGLLVGAAVVMVIALAAVGVAASSAGDASLIEKIRETIHQRAMEASKPEVVGSGINPGPDDAELRIAELEAGIKQLQEGQALTNRQLDLVIQGPSVWRGWWVTILLGMVASFVIMLIGLKWDAWFRGVL